MSKKPVIEESDHVAADKSIYKVLDLILKDEYMYVLDNILYHSKESPVNKYTVFEKLTAHTTNLIYSIFSNSIGHIAFSILTEAQNMKMDYTEFRIAIHENIQAAEIFQAFLAKLKQRGQIEKPDYDLSDFFKDFMEYYMTFAASHCAGLTQPEQTTTKH